MPWVGIRPQWLLGRRPGGSVAAVPSQTRGAKSTVGTEVAESGFLATLGVASRRRGLVTVPGPPDTWETCGPCLSRQLVPP